VDQSNQSPSTTASATNRIDLDALSAALTAAGWERSSCAPGWRTFERYGDVIEIDHEGSEVNIFPRFWINALDPHWQHTLALIRVLAIPAPGIPGFDEQETE
jgi:hypothetical protein